MAALGKMTLLLSFLIIFLSGGISATDEGSYSLQKIFRLRFIFDEQDAEETDVKTKTSVVVLEKDEPKQDPLELMSNQQNAIYSLDDSYNSVPYKLPDSTLTFCFIVVIFYMLYLSLRMFMKPEVDTSDSTIMDQHILQQLLINHQFGDATIPEKLRSLYDDGEHSGVTDLTKINLIIDSDHLSGTSSEGMEKPPGYEDVCVSMDVATGEDVPGDSPPPYSEVTDVPPVNESDRDERLDDTQVKVSEA